ncbi:MAG: hypothetical protein AAB955_00855 [Patescibacteria group bacterium]
MALVERPSERLSLTSIVFLGLMYAALDSMVVYGAFDVLNSLDAPTPERIQSYMTLGIMTFFAAAGYYAANQLYNGRHGFVGALQGL